MNLLNNFFRFSIGFFLLSTMSFAASAASERRVNVFAAASLKPVLDQLAADFSRENGNTISMTYAGSNVLARQIEEGAPADIFISADQEWMDSLESKTLILTETRFDFTANRLVLITQAENSLNLKIEVGFALSDALDSGRIAMADVRAVPAGRYAKAALTTLGVWDQVADKTAQTENVRATLAFVARGEATFGIVYQTDAISEAKVRVLDVFPATTHAPIIYPAALIKGSTAPAGPAFLSFLRSATALKYLEFFGFVKPN
jgi:molybdate transport system substrate-binding protein